MTTVRKVRLEISTSIPGENWVTCPVCALEYVALGQPRVDAAGDITIPARCECDHAFEICFTFHKGNTSVFCRVIDGR